MPMPGSDRGSILGMPVDLLANEDFLALFLQKAEAGDRGFVCVTNVHQCIEAYDNPDFAAVINAADLVMPDSTVLQKFIGLKYRRPPIETLRGDMLTVEICQRAAERKVPVALIGGKDTKILASMVNEIGHRCPGINVAFAWSPPFGLVSATEEAEMLTRLAQSGARIVFVGLGCPKQERWMAKHTHRVPAMMIGVGAAFDFISGQVKTSPRWMHGAGLEWLHRLVSEPRRLWKRYLATSPRFIWLFVTRELRKPTV